MEAFITSFLVVAVAEIGDKTQLLALALAARYRRPFPTAAGMLAATVLNHTLAGSLGTWLPGVVPSTLLPSLLAASFFAMAIWALIPDKLDEKTTRGAHSVFVTSMICFFLAEMGDKTQIATIALAARFEMPAAVILGTILGLLAVNIPVIWLSSRINLSSTRLRMIRFLAAGLFVVLGVTALIGL